jgi:hypothetical protein
VVLSSREFDYWKIYSFPCLSILVSQLNSTGASYYKASTNSDQFFYILNLYFLHRPPFYMAAKAIPAATAPKAHGAWVITGIFPFAVTFAKVSVPDDMEAVAVAVVVPLETLDPAPAVIVTAVKPRSAASVKVVVDEVVLE